MHDDLRNSLRGQSGTLRAELERLVRIPSVSAPGFDPDGVVSSAEAVAGILDEAGLGDVRLLHLERAHPAVYGALPAPPGAPTVLLYAHHDVQPPGDLGAWSSAPFEPVERDGRLYGRGTADDKCGVVMHAAAVRTLGQECPVGVKVFVEGEEEIGSLHLPGFLARYHDLLAADHIVVGDSGNPRVGVPAFTTSLRGLVDCVVEVRTLRHAVHSGEWGGPVPDALTCLIRTLTTLHDADGQVAVEGLASASGGNGGPTEEEIRDHAGVLDGVRLLGSGALSDRLWRRPAIAVLAIDAPPVPEAVNALVPVARAKVSLRLAPGDDPARAMDALVAHLERNVPWGAEVTVTRGARGEPFSLATGGPAYDAYREGFREAWGKDPVEIGVGGSIPFVAALAGSFPEASILLTGSSDPTSRIHGPDESVDLDEVFRSTLAETIALRLLGETGAGQSVGGL